MNEALNSYREQINLADQESIRSFDKSLITLSAGALGLSLTFVKEIVGPANVESTQTLVIAWICWIASLAMTLFSFYCSHLALRKTMEQIDNGTINSQSPGGRWTVITNGLNALSGVAFLGGVVFIVIFVSINIGAPHG